MQISSHGKQMFQTLQIRADTINRTDDGGAPRYTMQEPYEVIDQDFRAMAESPHTTDDEKALAKLALGVSDSWLPQGRVDCQDVLQGHIGILEAVESEFESPSKANIGQVIAGATLAAIDSALENSHGPSWLDDNMKNGFLEAGFEAISESNARKTHKSIADRSLRVMERDDFAGDPPMSNMKKIAGKWG